MGSISIKKNGVQVNYNLAYLDFEKATAANTANAGSTDLGSLIYITGNILAAGTLQNVPDGAEDAFYYFKSDSLPAGVLQSVPADPVHSDALNVLYLGVKNQSNTNYLDYFQPLADDLRPDPNQDLDPFNTDQNCIYKTINDSSPAFLLTIPRSTSYPDTQYFWNNSACAFFDTENGGRFGAYLGAVPGVGGTSLGCIVHSFNSLSYFGPSGNSVPSITGNQPRNFVSGYPSMPYGPTFGGDQIVNYPSNGVDWTAHAKSETTWDVGDEAGKVFFEVSAEFVVASINGKLFAGLAACHWNNAGRIDQIQVMLLPAWFWGAGSMDLTFDFEIPDYSDTWYGPASSANPGGAGGYTVKQGETQIASSPHASYWSFVTQGVGGAHCYLVNGAALAKLQDALWSDLMTDEVKQYILGCIIAVHQMPNELMPTPNAGNAVSSVMIGNIPVPITGGAKAQIVDPFVPAFKVASFTASDRWNSLAYFNGGNYLDYEPNVQITLFLPFAGTLQLSPSQCIGGSIDIYATSNASNGDLMYTVVTTSDGKLLRDADGGPVKNTFFVAGNSAMPIILTGTTTGQKQRTSDIFSAIGGALSVVAGAASGNVAGIAAGIRGMAEAENSLAHIQQNAISAGGIAGSAAGIGMQQIILRITRPVKAFDKDWIDLGGIRSEMRGTLEKAKTEDSSAFTIVKYCELSGLDATDAEKNELAELLKGGVFL